MTAVIKTLKTDEITVMHRVSPNLTLILSMAHIFHIGEYIIKIKLDISRIFLVGEVTAIYVKDVSGW